ncbi:hypothetical protein AJ80_06239 [Polytolypa hystricis UAMH7299]|uniref:Uncharacterized protein n=1 Tax=Polytolypa hystricis (strain UAMH7299) TaxID=1447883 RepID=A0A2B7XYG1_POLH7|nr:hypothetical protein AJ80_06239 [Polytolypa hystricis UAMH7299]
MAFEPRLTAQHLSVMDPATSGTTKWLFSAAKALAQFCRGLAPYGIALVSG